jgi:hypothetical protein
MIGWPIWIQARAQHWCSLGEIVSSIGLVRVLLRVKDKNSQVVTIGLYTDDRGQALAPAACMIVRTEKF